MKLSTADAALSLSPSLHPVNLMLLLSEVGYSFDDVWPAIEDSWIETVRAIDWNKFAPTQQKGSDTIEIFAQSLQFPDLGVSDEAGLVVEKLWRNSKWGHAYVTVEAMQKHTHLDVMKLDMAIQELLRRRLLIQQEKSDTYSLDSGKRVEIERIANIMVKRASNK
jgi:hypothetical protein